MALARQSSGGRVNTARFQRGGFAGWLAPVLGALALMALVPVSCSPAREQQGQPPLAAVELRIIGAEGETVVLAEVARTDKEQSAGLMFRREMDANAGMLFPFPRPHQASFWMKNTPLPLDIAYIHASGRILEIHILVPHDTTPVISRARDVSYALEVHRGWFAKHGIRPGDVVEGLPEP